MACLFTNMVKQVARNVLLKQSFSYCNHILGKTSAQALFFTFSMSQWSKWLLLWIFSITSSPGSKHLLKDKQDCARKQFFRWSTHVDRMVLYCLPNSKKYLLSVLLPGEESPRHEEAVQTPEVQPAEGGEAREEGQQRGLCYTAARQGQALQLRAQAQSHLKREKDKNRQQGQSAEEKIITIQREETWR